MQFSCAMDNARETVSQAGGHSIVASVALSGVQRSRLKGGTPNMQTGLSCVTLSPVSFSRKTKGR
jgi:hypothetical protein